METFYIFGSNTTFLYWNQTSVLLMNVVSFFFFFPKALQVEAMLIFSWFTIILLFGSSVEIQPLGGAYWGLRLPNFLLSLAPPANSRCIFSVLGQKLKL